MAQRSRIVSTPLLFSPWGWPLPLALGGELLLLAWLRIAGGPLPVTRLSLAVALLIVASGLTPALLRPAPASVLAGCSAILLAGVVLVPLDLAALDPGRAGDGPPPAGLVLRVVSLALLGPALVHLTTVFPEPRPLPRGLVAGGYLVSLALLAGVAFGLALLPPEALAAPPLWGAALGLAAMARLGYASRRSPAARLALAGALAAELPLLLRPLSAIGGWPAPPYDLVLAAQLLLPLGLSAAVLRHDLFGIDAALRRALAYTVLSGGLLALYLGLSAGLGALLTRALPAFSGMAAVAAMLVAAAAFGPLRARAVRLVDRLLYPERLAFGPALAAARARLSCVVRRDEVVELLTRALPEQIGAAWGGLSLAPAPELAPQADADRGWTARLEVGDASLGRLWLGPRRSGLAYDAEEQAGLDALARQAALTLAYADTVEDLRELNRDLEARVAAGTARLLDRERALAVIAERQRLARDLHDSVTQALFSISLGARATRRLVEHDPSEAAQALEDQEATAHQALAEMRELLGQLRAPLGREEHAGELVDLAALLGEECALLSRRDGLVVDLDLPRPVTLPRALAGELALLAREALHNAAKHSGASQARLEARIEEDGLALTIADAGRGFDPAADRGGGLGLRGMAERARGLGGTLAVSSAPGQGTVVLVRVPGWGPARQRREAYD